MSCLNLSCTVASSPPQSVIQCVSLAVNHSVAYKIFEPFLPSQWRSVPLNALAVRSQMMLDGSQEGRWCVLSCLSLVVSQTLASFEEPVCDNHHPGWNRVP